MESKISYYDLVGYIVPGGVAMLSLLYSFKISGFITAFDFGNASHIVYFLIFAYFLGNIIQSLSEIYQRYFWVKKWGGMPSSRILNDGEDRYTKEYMRSLNDAIIAFFGVKYESIEPLESDNVNKEKFFNCYNLVINKKDFCVHLETLISSYAFFRGLFIASMISCVSFLLTATLLISKYNKFHDYKHIALSLFLFISFFASIFICQKRAKKKGDDFVDAVYRSFYVYFRELTLFHKDKPM